MMIYNCTKARLGIFVSLCALTAPLLQGEPRDTQLERAQALINAHETETRDLQKKTNQAWWYASLSGKDADFARKEKLQNQLDALLHNESRFAQIQDLRKDPQFQRRDPRLARQIEVLFYTYQPAQIESELNKQMNAKSNAIEQMFNTYRAKVGDKSYTSNEISDLLKNSLSSEERRLAWEASKGVGKIVEKDLLELVHLRNQSAHSLGYPNFHAMQLALNEQDSEQVLQLFDDLDTLTRGPFIQVKAEIDTKLAERFHLAPEALLPWHYQDLFFQEVPAVYDYNPDAIYQNQKVDLADMTRRFYTSIGLPIDDIMNNSSLYEQPGKSPHAFCSDIDREGDVRVLMNYKPNQYWMSTSLHEFGHSVYTSKYIPHTVPYLLRGEAHILTTEGLAMMFQRLVRKSAWLQQMGVRISDAEKMDLAEKKMMRAELLIFSRWTQVIFRFEKSMYENPDQDLNTLWWNLVEKYQGIKRPAGRNAPDYATKIHVVVAPCYYHNYEMGELFASQVHHTIAKVLNQSPEQTVYVNQPKVGEFLRKKIFAHGATLDWNQLTKVATGAPLSIHAFAEDLQ
jgi:peptidyl-dipeptidase A